MFQRRPRTAISMGRADPATEQLLEPGARTTAALDSARTPLAVRRGQRRDHAFHACDAGIPAGVVRHQQGLEPAGIETASWSAPGPPPIGVSRLTRIPSADHAQRRRVRRRAPRPAASSPPSAPPTAAPGSRANSAAAVVRASRPLSPVPGCPGSIALVRHRRLWPRAGGPRPGRCSPTASAGRARQ